MPSIQQLKKRNDSDENYSYNQVANKKSNKSTFIKILVVILLFGGWILYRDKDDIYTIPENIYETRNDGYFKDLFATPYKKLIWIGADCPVSAKRKEMIDKLLEATQLNKYYIHHPYLQNRLSIKCNGPDCVDIQIMQRCEEVCIIIPTSRQIISIKEKNMFRALNKYKGAS